ncbi:MAG TPA: hypothetical protein VK809_01890 [Bacteroidia bacterium]|jgi:hypothetical protein|nr:hypothetical protein [Bacteroidia bacterium]
MNDGSTILALCILFPISYWVYNDARSRGMNATGWTIFVILILIVGLPAYFMMRKPKIEDPDEESDND